MTPEFTDLLAAAEEAARADDWHGAQAALSEAMDQGPAHRAAPTALAVAAPGFKAPVAAMVRLQGAVSHAPGSIDGCNSLGLLLGLRGDYAQAERAFQAALALDGSHAPSWRHLAQVLLEQPDRVAEGVEILAALVQADPQDVEALTLLAGCYAAADQHDSAVLLYQRALDLEPGHAKAGTALKALEDLQNGTSVEARQSVRPGEAAVKGGPTPASPLPKRTASGGAARIAILTAPGFASTAWSRTAHRALHAAGFACTLTRQIDPADLDGFDGFVVDFPATSQALQGSVDRLLAAGKSVVLHIQDDVRPGSAGVESSEPRAVQRAGKLEDLERLVERAGRIVVPNEILAERYRPLAQVTVIPPAWDPADPLWQRPAPKRTTVNVGLVGGFTVPADVSVVRKALTRLIDHRPETVLTVVGDLGLFNGFPGVRPERTLYVPMPEADLLPYLYGYLDILVVPLRDHPACRGRSHQPLLEAGVRGIPWVAGTAAGFESWAAGGNLVGPRDDWFGPLDALVRDPELRRTVGGEGRARAMQASCAGQAPLWQAAIGI